MQSFASSFASLPQLADTDKRVLRVLQRSGVAAGWQLLSEAYVTADELGGSAEKLAALNLISIKGSLSGPEISSTYFNILPSNLNLADMVLNSR